MNRFDGSSILVVDIDRLYGTQLVEVLVSHGARCVFASGIAEAKKLFERFDFDLVVSNYYLADGIIHQLIEWSLANIKRPPIFTAMGYPLAGDAELLQKHCIAEVFSKNDRTRILTGLSKLLFDFHQLKNSLMELIDPTEVVIEMKVNSHRLLALPIEISSESIFLSLGQCFEPGLFGEMNFSLNEKKYIHSFVIPGHFASQAPGGQHFNINQTYFGHWKMFLNLMDEKQTDISTFMKKAAGY